MDPLLLVVLALAAGWISKVREQRQRIALLAGFLSRYEIEKHMEAVTQGYLRALGEQDPARQEQIWSLLRGSEQQLCAQFSRFAGDIAAAEPARTQVSKLPLWLPFACTLYATFDLRKALAVHARGICRAVEVTAASARDRAFTISAELFLMQHTCHWFCKSRLVASARMLSRHQTSYDQLIAAVQPQTRSEYLALVRMLGG